MICTNSDNCTFYRKYSEMDSRQHRLLIESYCNGDILKQMCRRQKYKAVYSKEAPDALAPNGYLVDTHRKIRIEDTRKHKRHKVIDCVCLFQVVETERTFSGWIVDISDGGVQLEITTNIEELDLCTKTSQIKILGYSAENIPVSLSKENLKMVWQNQQVLGCEFIAA